MVVGLRIIFLALLWLFILFAANVIRTDIFGQRVTRARTEDVPTGPRRLIVTEGRSQGAAYRLDPNLLSIGRAADSTVLIDDDYASTRHAHVLRDDQDRWIVEDLHSTNGTYVNGQRIEAPTIITPDDVVRIGRTQLRLEG